jgi:hypothetical protein
MSSKGKTTLFRRKNRDPPPTVEPIPSDSSQLESPPESPASVPAATSLNSTPRNGAPHYRGAVAINSNAARDIGDLKQSTRDGVRGGLNNEVGGISPGINQLLSPSEKKQGFELPRAGGHFLEPSIDHLHNDFLDKWKAEILFPNIQRWADLYLVEYIQNLLHKQTEDIIEKYENAIAIIEEKHKQEIIELEKAHKELLLTVVKKTWGDYEKKVANARIVKHVNFGFHPSTEKEPWGDDLQHVVPEVMEHVPRVYEPKVGLEEHPNSTDQSDHGHGWQWYRRKHDDSTAPNGHDSEGIYVIPPSLC